MRDEVRVRLPLRATARFRRASAVLALSPSLPVLHGEPDVTACRDFSCSSVTLLHLSQAFAIELQAGMRF